jgi:hypothetical protein
MRALTIGSWTPHLHTCSSDTTASSDQEKASCPRNVYAKGAERRRNDASVDCPVDCSHRFKGERVQRLHAYRGPSVSFGGRRKVKTDLRTLTRFHNGGIPFSWA